VFRERGKLSQAEGAFIRARDGWLAGTQALSLLEVVIDYLANHASG